MPAQIGEGQVGAVRVPVDVPPVDAERPAQIGEVRGVLGGVVGAQRDSAGRDTGEAVPALLGRAHEEPPGRRRVVAQPHGVRVEAVDLRAGEVRLGVQRSALGHDDQIAVPVEARVDQEGNVPDRIAAGTARHEHHRIRGRPRRGGSDDRDGQPDGPPIAAGPVLGDLEDPAPPRNRLGRVRAGTGHEPCRSNRPRLAEGRRHGTARRRGEHGQEGQAGREERRPGARLPDASSCGPVPRPPSYEPAAPVTGRQAARSDALSRHVIPILRRPGRGGDVDDAA